MKRISWALKGLIFCGALVTVGQSQAAEYIVKYRSTAFFSNLSLINMQVMDTHDSANLLKVNIPDSSKLESMLKLFSNPNVEYIVPNIRLRSFLQPVNMNPAALRSQWAIAKVQAEKAWQRAGNKGNKAVVVAVIDTGVDYRHPALAPNMVPGYDFKQKDSDPMDKTGPQNPGHGTHCAGVVGATGLQDGGTIGLAPDISIMPLRFLDENGGGDLMDGIKAIDFAIEKNVQVISASWGAKVSRSQAQPLIEAVERADKAGIPFVVAAANDGQNNDKAEYYPTNAGTDNTISVAASGSSDGKPSWSNFGKAKVSLAAPGEGIISTLPSGKYGELSGTSMATPLVAGLVGFIRAQDPSLTPLEIKALLQASGDKVGIAVACDCRVNAFTAVDMVLSKAMFVSPNSLTMGKGDTRAFAAVYGTAPFQFTSSNPAVGTIDAAGVLTAVAEGETTVAIKDAAGKSASSYKIYVGQPQSSNPGNPGDPGGDPGACPIGDPALCEIICQIMPDAPFCAAN
jgi:thermitase